MCRLSRRIHVGSQHAATVIEVVIWQDGRWSRRTRPLERRRVSRNQLRQLRYIEVGWPPHRMAWSRLFKPRPSIVQSTAPCSPHRRVFPSFRPLRPLRAHPAMMPKFWFSAPATGTGGTWSSGRKWRPPSLIGVIGMHISGLLRQGRDSHLLGRQGGSSHSNDAWRRSPRPRNGSVSSMSRHPHSGGWRTRTALRSNQKCQGSPELRSGRIKNARSSYLGSPQRPREDPSIPVDTRMGLKVLGFSPDL